MASSGATSDGFSTMVQPAASAGATLQAIWFSGQFHGVIMPTTPIGSRDDSGRAVRLLERIALQHLDRRLDMAEAGAGLGSFGRGRSARPSRRRSRRRCP